VAYKHTNACTSLPILHSLLLAMDVHLAECYNAIIMGDDHIISPWLVSSSNVIVLLKHFHKLFINHDVAEPNLAK